MRETSEIPYKAMLVNKINASEIGSITCVHFLKMFFICFTIAYLYHVINKLVLSIVLKAIKPGMNSLYVHLCEDLNTLPPQVRLQGFSQGRQTVLQTPYSPFLTPWKEKSSPIGKKYFTIKS